MKAYQTYGPTKTEENNTQFNVANRLKEIQKVIAKEYSYITRVPKKIQSNEIEKY